MASRYGLGNIGNWNLFGTSPTGRPGIDTWQTEYPGAQTYYGAEAAWAAIEEEKRKRKAMYKEMAQTTGDYAPKFTGGEYKKSVPSLSMVSGMAPVNERALYGEAAPFPGILSIVNPRQKWS